MKMTEFGHHCPLGFTSWIEPKSGMQNVRDSKEKEGIRRLLTVGAHVNLQKLREPQYGVQNVRNSIVK